MSCAASSCAPRKKRRPDGSLHPLRRERGRPHQRGPAAEGHAHLRPVRARASRQEFHAHRLTRTGGAVMKIKKGDKVSCAQASTGEPVEVIRAMPFRGTARARGVNVAKRRPEADPRHHAGHHRQVHPVPASAVSLWCSSHSRAGGPLRSGSSSQGRAKIGSASMWSRAVTTIEAGTLPAPQRALLDVLRPQLQEELGLATHAGPRLEKIVLTAASAGPPSSSPSSRAPARPPS